MNNVTWPSKHVPVFISLGGNKGDVYTTAIQAVKAILAFPGNSQGRLSGWYRTQPVGEIANEWFYNAVFFFQTVLPPTVLLHMLLDIEQQHGRDRTQEIRWGDRTLDLDLLFYGDCQIKSEELEIPHPRLWQRRFVLQPFCDLAPQWIHPVFGKTIDMLLQDMNDSQQAVEPIFLTKAQTMGSCRVAAT